MNVIIFKMASVRPWTGSQYRKKKKVSFGYNFPKWKWLVSASRIILHSFSVNYSGDRQYGLVAWWLVLIVNLTESTVTWETDSQAWLRGIISITLIDVERPILIANGTIEGIQACVSGGMKLCSSLPALLSAAWLWEQYEQLLWHPAALTSTPWQTVPMSYEPDTLPAPHTHSLNCSSQSISSQQWRKTNKQTKN